MRGGMAEQEPNHAKPTDHNPSPPHQPACPPTQRRVIQEATGAMSRPAMKSEEVKSESIWLL